MLSKITSQYMGLDLTLEGLARVNYLVGVNGCGKTRFLNSIKQRMSFYINPNEEDINNKLPVTFTAVGGHTYSLEKDGGLANQFYELDSFMVKGEKRIRLGLNDEFKNHSITKKLTNFFYPSANFDFKLLGDNVIKAKDLASDNSAWVELDSFAAGFQSLFKLWSNTFFNKSPEKKGLYLFTLDEIDRHLHLHPTLAKKLPIFLDCFLDEIEKLLNQNICKEDSVKTQAFLTTHSIFTIRGALEHDSHKIFQLENGGLKKSFDRQHMIQNSVFSFDNVLADLGFSMQDIFYPESLICVEGPVDVLYLQYWLEKYLEEKGIPKNRFIKGIHYDFFEFGGALAAHLTFESNFNKLTNNDLIPKNLVNILSLNRKVFLMVDDDSNDAFEKSKERLRKSMETKKNCVFFRNKKYRTIECLLTDKAKKSEDQKNKLNAALVNIKSWRAQEFLLKDFFHPELETLMKSLYQFLSEK